MSLATYPADFFTGNVACGDVLLKNIELSVTANHAPVGHAVSTGSPGTIDARELDFVWPQGYSLQTTGSGVAVVGPNGTPVLPDGIVIGEMGVCVGATVHMYKVATIGLTPTP
ncbi:MAG: hypothetical protein ACRDG3_06770 [Tepidiformaceae bacterium]